MRIIIIDDDIGIAETFALSFRISGLTALPFTDPVEALEAIQPDDIVISDYHMPGMTGLEVAEKAYLLGWRGALFIMSGNSLAIREQLIHPLLQSILDKPLSGQELLAAVLPTTQRGKESQ